MRTIKYKYFAKFILELAEANPDLGNLEIPENEFVAMAKVMAPDIPESFIRDFVEIVSDGAYELEITDEIENADKILELES